ncbi:MAG TPA: arginase family protein [Sphingobacteriaceae bacterium]
MAHLATYTRDDINALTRVRSGETKLGEKIETITQEELSSTPAKFILLGICEDIGVRANLGIGGTQTAWKAALASILNVQYTGKIPSQQIAVLGALEFREELVRADRLEPSVENDLAALRVLVSEIDSVVTDTLKTIFAAGKVPVVVGGGHNNSYPIIKAFSEAYDLPVNTINLDAHADFRAREGRHSGNGFSYAFHNGFLRKYSVIGLHENYNSQSMIKEMAAYPDRISYCFFEDLLKEDTSYDKAFAEALNFTNGLSGLEIDLDCIAGVLSSAFTPSGFSATQIRELIYQTKPYKMQYLHITEGTTKLADGRQDDSTGKLISYLVMDFIKAQS